MWQLFNLEQQYARYPDIQREEVQKLQEWVRVQPHLPDVGEHEALLFFHACDNQIQYAKQVLDAYYTFRTNNEEFFGNVDMKSPQMKRVQKAIAGYVLDKRTAEGYAVVIGRLLDTDPTNFDFVGAFKLYCISQDKMLLENELINGITTIIDFTGCTFGHLARVNLFQLKHYLYFLQETIPTRLKSVHFINGGSTLDKLMQLINPLLKKGLKEIFHVHNSLEDLHKYIARDILPKDLGGPGMHSKDLCEIFYRKLRDHRLEIIEYHNNHRTNEQLRPIEQKSSSDLLFGTEGNFKKLNID